MRWTYGNQRFGLVATMMLVAALVLAVAPRAEAQKAQGVFTVVNGQVEIMPAGQTQWIRATVGTRVGEGDDVRALARGNGEVRLPDGSTLLVAENSRFKVTSLDYDPQNRPRRAVFHLAIGKLRAVVVKISAALVQARQGSFGITTPTAVAAVRGTTLLAQVDAQGNTVFFVTDGTATIRDNFGRTLTLTAGQKGTFPPPPAPGVAPPPPAAAAMTPAEVTAVNVAVQAATNPVTAGAAQLTGAVVVKTAQDVVDLTLAIPAAPAPAPPTLVVNPAPQECVPDPTKGLTCGTTVTAGSTGGVVAAGAPLASPFVPK